MTPDDPETTGPARDDAVRLGELARRLAVPELDRERAAQIGWTARRVVGEGLSVWRFAEPLLVTVMTTSYFVWAVLRMVDALPHR